MRKLSLMVLMAASFILTGCFQIEGVHVLHYYGESDSGSYRIKLTRLVVSRNSKEYQEMMSELRSWSRPTTRSDDDYFYFEDDSGRASMEHFYQTFDCQASPQPGYMDCHYAFKLPKDLGQLPDWSVDWEVVLQPGMKLISSNHQRTRRENGRDRLIWYFDGNETSSASVDFTVRTPKAQ